MRKEFLKAAVFPRRFQAGCKSRPVFFIFAHNAASNSKHAPIKALPCIAFF